MSLGQNIAKFRKGKGWTQEELAKASGLSRGYIAAIEEEGRHPAVKALALIAKSLGISLEQLLGEEEK